MSSLITVSCTREPVWVFVAYFSVFFLYILYSIFIVFVGNLFFFSILFTALVVGVSAQNVLRRLRIGLKFCPHKEFVL